MNFILSDALISNQPVPTFPFQECGNKLQTLLLLTKEVGSSQQVLCLLKYSDTVQVHIFSPNYSVLFKLVQFPIELHCLKDYKVHRCQVVLMEKILGVYMLTTILNFNQIYR